MSGLVSTNANRTKQHAVTSFESMSGHRVATIVIVILLLLYLLRCTAEILTFMVSLYNGPGAWYTTCNDGYRLLSCGIHGYKQCGFWVATERRWAMPYGVNMCLCSTQCGAVCVANCAEIVSGFERPSTSFNGGYSEVRCSAGTKV